MSKQCKQAARLWVFPRRSRADAALCTCCAFQRFEEEIGFTSSLSHQRGARPVDWRGKVRPLDPREFLKKIATSARENRPQKKLARQRTSVIYWKNWKVEQKNFSNRKNYYTGGPFIGCRRLVSASSHLLLALRGAVANSRSALST